MVKKITVISSSFSPDIGPGSIRTSQMVEELSRNNKNYITVITQEANRYSSNIVHDDTYSRIQNIKNIKIIRHKKILLFGNYENKYLNYILFFLRVLISNKGRDYDLIWTTSSRFFTIFNLPFQFKKK